MRSAWIKKIVLLLSSVLFCALISLLFEATTRIFKPEINYQDTEHALMRERAFGETYGWQPNATGISFGKPVFIDDYGFRRMNAPTEYDSSWIILGDSVTFGVGVDTEETYVQLLQNNYPSARLWNTAVIGYDVRNYRDVLAQLVDEKQQIRNLRRVIMFFCLNDVDLSLNVVKPAEAKGFREGIAEPALSFLRRHSKFYMLLKNLISDRSRFYFLHDYQLYKEPGRDFNRALSILDEINDLLRVRGIAFTVVVLPYEYQLRQKEEQYLLPQRMLAAHLREKNIPYLDAYEYFARLGGDEREYFLYADFGHLSRKGHQVVFDFLKERLKVE